LNEWKVNQLIEKYQDGYNARQLSSIYNISVNTVYNLLHTNNIPLQTKKRGKYNKHDDNNQSQYHNLVIRQIVREYKTTGKAYIMTDSVLRKIKDKIQDCIIEDKFDYHTQCKYYLLRREE